MRYICKKQINNNDIIEYSGTGNDPDELVDYVIKNTIIGLIDEIPIETLKLFFNIQRIERVQMGMSVTEITASLNINE